MQASRLIERLDAALVDETDPLRREYLKAERAGALARLGLLADARFALQGLRTQNLRHRDARLAAWVHLVDGLIDHFDTIAPDAVHKFARALEEAERAGDEPMQALAAAWLANKAFNASDLPALTRHLGRALRLAEPDHHAARARASLVLADAYRVAGDDAASQTWYLRARAHASADGDSSMISVMLYNLSAHRAAQVARADAFGRADPEHTRKVLLEVESTANYDWGTGVASLSAMVPVTRAQLLAALGRHHEAAQLLDEHLERARLEGMGHHDASLVAVRAWCRAKTGRVADALADVQEAERGAGLQQDPDDRAAAYARLAALHREGGREHQAVAWQALADEALAQYEAWQGQLHAALDAALLAAGHALVGGAPAR